MDQRNTSTAVHQRRQRTPRSRSISKLLALHAEMRHSRYQITISLFLGREWEVEHHRPSQGAEQISLHMHGSKWLLRNHLPGRKLIPSNQALFLDLLEVMLTLLCCR